MHSIENINTNLSKNDDIVETTYNKFFDKKAKNIIILQIKSDLLDKYTDNSILELEMLSNNIYEFSCLKAHHISEDDISRYLSHKNMHYYNKLSNQNIDNFANINYENLKQFIKKYVKIVESSI